MKEKIEEIVELLLKWYEGNKRILPWREDRNPYHVWISEIMLQQTRIEAVKKYYTNFMKELPTIERLANIPEEKLLKLWEGLGYYSRAKKLKKAAQRIIEEYNGIMPKTYDELLKLPGIGKYTAGAIASICYNEKVTAVDGNVLRVISRVTGSKKDVLLPNTKKEVENSLEKIMPKQSGNFNEALMELGEMICLPNGEPKCSQCPLQQCCIAYKENLIESIPVRIKKMKRKKEEKTVIIFITNEGKMAIQKREEKGLLSGMYQLPNVSGYYSIEELENILKLWNIKPKEIEYLGEKKHIFTHMDWLMKGYLVTVDKENELFIWASQKEISEKYALPTAFQKFIKNV